MFISATYWVLACVLSECWLTTPCPVSVPMFTEHSTQGWDGQSAQVCNSSGRLLPSELWVPPCPVHQAPFNAFSHGSFLSFPHVTVHPGSQRGLCQVLLKAWAPLSPGRTPSTPLFQPTTHAWSPAGNLGRASSDHTLRLTCHLHCPPSASTKILILVN